MLAHLIAHVGEAFTAKDLARAVGAISPQQLTAAHTACLVLYRAGAISRLQPSKPYSYMVRDTAPALGAARAYLDRPLRGLSLSGVVRASVKGTRALYPGEPLRYFVDDDGDLAIVGRESGRYFLVIPKLDAVDLLAFSQKTGALVGGE